MKKIEFTPEHEQLYCDAIIADIEKREFKEGINLLQYDRFYIDKVDFSLMVEYSVLINKTFGRSKVYVSIDFSYLQGEADEYEIPEFSFDINLHISDRITNLIN